MKDYIINGKVVNITLDNGKVVRASTEFINKMVDNLQITEYDAVMTWLEDNDHIENVELEELDQHAKANGATKVIKAKESKPKAKTPKERVKKDNPTKEMVIKKVANMLPEFATNVVVENAGKLITFTIGDTDFKLDLVQKRKPKIKEV